MSRFSRQTISSLAELITRGITPKYATSEDQETIEVVNQRCIRDGVINFSLARKHNLSQRKVSEAKILHAGDTLVNSTGVGTLGRTAYFSASTGGYTADSHVTIVRPLPDVEPKWLSYALKLLEPEIEFLAEGSTGQTELSKDRLGQLSIGVPVKEIQQGIAATLGALDDKIDCNTRSSEIIDNLLDSLFRKNFPFAYDPYLMNPESGSVGEAKDFFKIAIGKTPPRKQHEWFSTSDSDVTWVSISDLGDQDTFITHSREYLTSEAVNKFNVRVVPRGSILVSFKLTVGRVAIADSDLTTNEAIAHFVIEKEELRPYIYSYLKNFNYEELGNTSSIGKAINSKIIKSMPMWLPDEKNLNEFNKIAVPLLKMSRAITHENERLQSLRDTLLPELMSGRIRVPEAQEAIQDATNNQSDFDKFAAKALEAKDDHGDTE